MSPLPPPVAPAGAPVLPSPTPETPAAHTAEGPGQAELLAFVRRAAADTALVATLPLDPEGRTWLRLDGPGGSEAWLIGWPPGTGTGWHDHGGSYGAFATAAGSLREDSLAHRLPTDGRAGTTLDLPESVDRTRELNPPQGRAFGPHHVHQVLNTADHTHAVSVHAYYPPLPLMRRYSRSGQALRLEQIERPEDWQ
ncbi:cysteine dioxygenase [Streptomyces albidoflavus]|uniref:cysteine dioxygenase n=1 Tax=Streptomyces TaxID=1883 RepID=UPI000CD52CAF|nr:MULTISPECIES: cysteine dioxygenase [Streptomyces]MBK3387300.1 cysteine dioxygenase [Streptomyces sp. DEF1AK]MCL6278165.1 cysteine dioxygenase [Streptomyces albidoflavus]MCO6693840.1 cysteine dioxygenase [Streptomyces sp. Vc17.3-30]MCX4463665.1 cysteine dioxygenase [Streptomyces albidoflavus]WSI94815.1 cysteine dioxygenase [Streptomyces albidoflavus]